MKNIFLLIAGMSILLVTACSQEPAEIHYGSDECAYCLMMITDENFATQLVTDKGKSYPFDSIECLVSYYKENSDQLQEAKLWVTNYNEPGHWLDAMQAYYVKSEVIQSPMGESLLALPSLQDAKEHMAEHPGKLMQWEEITELKMDQMDMAM